MEKRKKKPQAQKVMSSLPHAGLVPAFQLHRLPVASHKCSWEWGGGGLQVHLAILLIAFTAFIPQIRLRLWVPFINKTQGNPLQSQLQGKFVPGRRVLLTTECQGKQSALQIMPNKQTRPGVKHDLYPPMVQSLLMPWPLMVILELCHSPLGHCYRLTLQVGSSNSLFFFNPPLERKLQTKIIKSTRAWGGGDM